MEEDRLRKAANIGRRAEVLLGDETVLQVFKVIELELLHEFRNAEVEKAQEYWRLLHAHNEIIHRLELAVANGREAEREIERLNEDARRRRDYPDPDTRH